MHSSHEEIVEQVLSHTQMKFVGNITNFLSLHQEESKS